MRIMSAILLALAINGCGGQEPDAAQRDAVAIPEISEDSTQQNYAIPMRNFAAAHIGPYHVQPMFEEEIEDGHYNIKVDGGEIKAIRIWVGPEDASGVMVVKTEIENDYHHGHVEVPSPVPADAMLWIEIEDPTGQTFKGSTPLQLAP